MKKQAYNLVPCQPTLQRLNHTVDEYDYYVNDGFCDDPKLSDDEIEIEISRVGIEIFCDEEKFVWEDLPDNRKLQPMESDVSSVGVENSYDEEKFVWEDLPDNRKLQTLVDWSAYHESVTLPVKTYCKEA